MKNISSFILDLIDNLRSDSELSSMLSCLYSQVPSYAVAPYLFMHLHNSKELKTFDRLSRCTMITCNIVSNSLTDSAVITERTENVCKDFFKKKKCVLSDIGYKISHLTDQTFESVISFEVLTSDLS